MQMFLAWSRPRHPTSSADEIAQAIHCLVDAMHSKQLQAMQVPLDHTSI